MSCEPIEIQFKCWEICALDMLLAGFARAGQDIASCRSRRVKVQHWHVFAWLLSITNLDKGLS